MDGGAWWAAVHGVMKSWTWLNNFTFTFHFPALEKEMATHSSVLAWRIPGTGEPGGLSSMGSQTWTRLKWLSSIQPYYFYQACKPFGFLCRLWVSLSKVKEEDETNTFKWYYLRNTFFLFGIGFIGNRMLLTLQINIYLFQHHTKKPIDLI